MTDDQTNKLSVQVGNRRDIGAGVDARLFKSRDPTLSMRMLRPEGTRPTSMGFIIVWHITTTMHRPETSLPITGSDISIDREFNVYWTQCLTHGFLSQTVSAPGRQAGLQRLGLCGETYAHQAKSSHERAALPLRMNYLVVDVD